MEMTRFLSSISSPSSKSPEELVYDKLVLFGIGLDEKKGQLVPKNADVGGLDLKEEDKLDRPIFTHIVDKMRLFAKGMGKNGEDSLVIPMRGVKNKTQIVADPLGGCNMGKDVNDGVVNSYGQVFWNDGSADKTKVYPKLYVVDGSIIPEPLGVNPSLTICAVSFRAAKHILVDISEGSLSSEEANKFLP